VAQLERPIQYFLAEFAFPTGDPLKKPSYDPQTLKLTTDRPVGIGPFMISSYTHGHEIDFAPNPYWYEGRLQLKQVRVPFILDSNTAYKEYQTGQTMLTLTGSSDAKKPDFHSQPLLQTDALYFNWTRPPFDDSRVRTAFAEATDVAAYDQAVGAGNPTHQWIPPGMPGYSSDFEQRPVVPFDAAQARKDLAAAGYPGGRGLPSISIAYAAAGPDSAGAPLALQAMWKQNLGVTIGLYQKPLSQIFSDDLGGATAKDQLFFLSWVADYPDPHDWTTVLWHRGAYYNTTGFRSDQFDALVDAADLESDQTKRLQEYRDAETILLQQVGIVPLDNPTSAYLLSPRVHGFRLDAQGGVPPRMWAGVYITA
jgi:peptide/nickel transport system substrate-binding protein/oligopeptide transport system substrate-binding protein